MNMNNYKKGKDMFESLEDILRNIQGELKIQRELLQITLDSLRTVKSVAKFLGVSTKTVKNMTKDGRLSEGKAWFYKDNGTIEFIPSGVIEVKSTRELKKVNVVDSIEQKIHPTASKFMVF